MAALRYLLLILLFMSCTSMGPLQTGSSSSVMFVQSAPVETTLADPSIPSAREVWPAMIREAKFQIDIAQMYVASKSGEAIEPVIEELRAASKRGVRIRMLLSKNMWDSDPNTLKSLQSVPGIEIRPLDLSKLTGGILHAKYWVIDQSDIFVGSQNFYLRSLTQILELGVKIHDEKLASELELIFQSDWKISQTDQLPAEAKPALPIGKPESIELSASPQKLNPSGVKSALAELLKLIDLAKTTIHIQLLDYGTSGKGGQWQELESALIRAGERGVQVEMIVSHWNASANAALNSLKTLARAKNLVVKIATLPLASQGPIPYARVIHSKFMTVDGQTLWLGTSNWSRGYFYETRGVELIFRSKELTNTAERLFSRLKDSAYLERVNDQTPVRPR